MTAAMFEERVDPGRIASAMLAAMVHLLLFAVLVFGVRWQNRPPEAISVELWEPPPAPVVEEARPAPEIKPEPVKPEPVVPKPDIALKAPPPKVAAKPRDEAAQRQIRDQLLKEQASFDVDRERQRIKDQLAKDSATASSRAKADWVDKIRAKIRGNIVLPPDIQGNPEAIFDVVQLPTAEVLSVKLRKSSGHPGYDGAVERAILKSSPLPKPDRPELFDRELKLTFRPKD
jgi:colicin import membrane protein